MTSRSLPPRRRAVLLVPALLLLGLAACGDDDDGDDTTSVETTTTTTAAPADAGEGAGDDGTDDEGDGDGAATTDGIEAQDFALTSLTVAPGAEVEVTNVGERPHTATADDGAFDSGTVQPGSSGSLTAPTEPGEYPFHCELHPAMTGTLTVQG